LKDGALVLGGSEGQLLVGFDESEHSVIVRRRIVAGDVAMYTALGGRAALSELLDQVVAEQFIRWCRLYELQKELGRCTCFLDATRELYWRRQRLG